MGLPAAPPYEPAHRVARGLAAAVLTGNQFQLASGEVTSWYVDAKPLIYGTGNAILPAAIAAVMRQLEITPDIIGGVGYGGVPLALLVGQLLHLPAFGVRAETKAHGLRGRIVGVLAPGARVVLLEDVLSTGGSVLSGLQAVEDAGGRVLAVICLLNRSQPLVQELAGRSGPVPVVSLLVPEDIGVS